MRKFLKLRLIIAIICFFMAGMITLLLLPDSNPMEEQVIELYTAVNFIREHDLIQESNLIKRKFLKSSIPDFNLLITAKTIEITDIANKIAKCDIYPGDIIIPDKCQSQEEFQTELIENEDRLVTVTIGNTAKGLGGYLRRGDIVSVAVQQKQNNVDIYASENKAKVYIPDNLRYLEIHSIQDAQNRIIAEDIENETNIQDEFPDTALFIPSTVTLLADEEQSIELIEAENNGIIHLIFIGRGEYAEQLLRSDS